MAVTNLGDVLHHSMKDVLSAGKQFRDARPKLAWADEGLVAESAIEEEGDRGAKDLLLTGAGHTVERDEVVSYADADEKLHALARRPVPRTPMAA